MAPRTWFATFTARPHAHYEMQCRAIDHMARRAVSEAMLSPADIKRETHNQFGRELTKWLKRLRKNSRAKIRYLLVQESHKSGLPHYHMLIHEVAKPVRWRDLVAAKWDHGFQKFKLVKDDSVAAGYVTKYVSKSNEARFRASFRYGRHDPLRPNAKGSEATRDLDKITQDIEDEIFSNENYNQLVSAIEK